MKWKVPALGVLVGGLCVASTSVAWNARWVVLHSHGSTQPDMLQIVDFDGDGRKDVLATNLSLNSQPGDRFGQSVVLFKQGPDGNLAAPTALFTAASAEDALKTSFAADINRDGRIDLLVSTRQLVILLQRADGSFARAEHLPPDGFGGKGMDRFALYDVDRDGVRDIVAMAWSDGGVGVYYLTQQGTVRELRKFAVPLQGYNDVESGDLDHDGKEDLVMSSGQGLDTPHFMILGPDGAGGLALRKAFRYESLNGPTSIAIGDFDGDGRQELATAQGRNTPAWVDFIKFDASLDIADFSYLPTHDLPYDLVAGDVNGDGRTDLSVAHNGWMSIGRYLQADGGLIPETLSTVKVSNWKSNSMAVGDINGDRCPDTAITDTNYLLQVVYGTECGISPLPTVDVGISLSTHMGLDYPGPPPLYSRIANIKYQIHAGNQIPIENPRARVVITALPGQELEVDGTRAEGGPCETVSETPRRAEYLCRGYYMMQTYGGNFPETDPSRGLPQTFSIYLDAAKGSRFDVWASLEHDSIAFDTNLDNQVRSARVDFLTGTGITAAPRHADFNGDGKSDILWHDAATRNNVIWRSASNAARKVVATVTDPAWMIAAQGDFDGNGDSDILWRHRVHGGNVIWSSGDSLSRHNLMGVTNLDWGVAGIGDFDGDGKSDILWRNPRTGANTIWGSGDYAAYQAMASVAGDTWKIVGVGDFDGDSRSDVLWRNSATGANTIWKSGNSLDRMNLASVTNLDWTVAGVGDFDRDGKSDILWRNPSSGVNAIWKAADFSAQQGVVGVTDPSWKIASIGDYDGDGKSDILWRNDRTGVGAIWKSGNHATQLAIGAMVNPTWSIVR